MFQYAMTILAVALRDRKGVTALEYGVLAVAILGAISVAATTLSGNLSSTFVKISNDL